MSSGDKVKKLLDTYFPAHGNNTEARRNERPTVEFKPTAMDAPLGSGAADKARNTLRNRQRQLDEEEKKQGSS